MHLANTKHRRTLYLFSIPSYCHNKGEHIIPIVAVSACACGCLFHIWGVGEMITGSGFRVIRVLRLNKWSLAIIPFFPPIFYWDHFILVVGILEEPPM